MISICSIVYFAQDFVIYFLHLCIFFFCSKWWKSSSFRFFTIKKEFPRNGIWKIFSFSRKWNKMRNQSISIHYKSEKKIHRTFIKVCGFQAREKKSLIIAITCGSHRIINIQTPICYHSIQRKSPKKKTIHNVVFLSFFGYINVSTFHSQLSWTERSEMFSLDV